jgi:hypothetical protein
VYKGLTIILTSLLCVEGS